MKTNTERLENMFKQIGLAAVLAHDKAHTYANVNPVDKFVLVMRGTVEDAIMDVVGRFNACWQWDWYNYMNDKPWNQAHNSRFAAFVNGITADAYLAAKGDWE